MGKAKMTLMTRTLDPVIINGRMSAFARVPYSIEVRLSQPLAENGYGKVTVDGIEISRGVEFYNDLVVKMYGLMLPVGEVARDYGRTHEIFLTGFTAADGTPFPDTKLKFKTAAHRDRNPEYDVHDEVALDAAREGMVLLKNENGVLPLKADTTLNLFGGAVNTYRTSAVGAGLINPRWQPTLFEAIRDHSTFKVNENLLPLYDRLQDTLPSQELLEEAKKLSNVGLVFISRVSGEFKDNIPDEGGYYLTTEEKAMIQAVAKAFPHTVAIINTGYPIEMGWTREYDIDAVLYTGYAGMLSAYALMEILDGRTNPSGKLPDTWAWDYYDYPSAKNFINFKKEDKLPDEKAYGIHLYYEEDIYMGYRYFDTFDKAPAFAFGHGLSYTDFALEPVSVKEEEGTVFTNVKVTNTGSCAGKEVVQLYMHSPEGRLEKPAHVLCGFEKTKRLEPGESTTLEIIGEPRDYASYDEEKSCYLLEAGEYVLSLGNSLDTAKEAFRFNLADETVIEQAHPLAKPVEEFPRLSKTNPTIQGMSKSVSLEERITIHAPRPEYHPRPLPACKGKKITFAQVKADPSLLDDFVAQMSDDELCTLNVCGGANWYLPWQNGAAGKTQKLSKYKLPVMYVSDGNTGLNLNKPNIGFPSSATVCASFNRELAEAVGKTIGEESREHGISMNLGPAMNLHRNILNGRHPEYFSEDPYLAGIMAGHHGKGLEEAGIGCCYKHLFCNGSDSCRKASQSIVSERALRELYFKVFETAMDIQMPSAVMTSYNSVNGIYPAENADLLQTLLREEWGFDGFIMTDWGTYDTVDSVEMVKAGNCWLTEGGKKYVKLLKAGVADGRLSRAVLENNVRWLVKTMLRLC